MGGQSAMRWALPILASCLWYPLHALSWVYHGSLKCLLWKKSECSNKAYYHVQGWHRCTNYPLLTWGGSDKKQQYRTLSMLCNRNELFKSFNEDPLIWGRWDTHPICHNFLLNSILKKLGLLFSLLSYFLILSFPPTFNNPLNLIHNYACFLISSSH